MPKQRISAQIQVADGAGGMRPVSDLRFEGGDWPIQLKIPAKDAKAWMAHLKAEEESRGWNSSRISQIDSGENSGTLSVHAGIGPTPPTLNIVWEKTRTGPLIVRARPSGDPILPLQQAREFLDCVRERVRKNLKDRAHRWGLLTYFGLPWRGELWLSEHLRLGPPSRFPETLLGPQVVVVDAMVDGVGSHGVTERFQILVRELQVFLGAVLGIHATPVRPEYGWVADFDEIGRPTACSLRLVGYWEVGPPRSFPNRGSYPSVPRETVVRPGLGRTGIWSDMHEQWVPADIDDLWRKFDGLPMAKRENFLRAGNAYLIAQSMFPAQRTACATFLVVACETLKPPGRRYDELNIYDVVASLISPVEATRLRQLSIHPQKVRSGHVHRGFLLADELLPRLIHDDFADPSFDEMLSELYWVSRVCLIEWLRLKGQFKIVRSSPAKQPPSKRRTGPRKVRPR